MYEAVRQRPSGPSKVAGLSAAVVITAGVAYALMTGLAQDIVKTIETHTELAIIQAPPKPEPPKPKKIVKIEKPTEVPTPPPLIETPPEIIPDTPPTIVAEPAPPVADPGPPAPVEAAGNNEVPPKLRSSDKPTYPSASARAQEQGTTGLQVCVNTSGRVTSASVAQSSGHPRLDDAALVWIKTAKFAPGSVGGVPRDMCGHEVFYQWNLEEARRS